MRSDSATLPSLPVAVWLERRPLPSPWEGWSFGVRDVVPQDMDAAPALKDPDAGQVSCWRQGGLSVSLHRDESEGYYLNLSSGAPVWFVMWRVEEDDPSRAFVQTVTLSYHEAGRLLDAQEHVDTVPLPPEVQAWLAEYTQLHYRPEPKQRRRPASFVAPQDR